MSKSKHTPGPWRTYRNPVNGYFMICAGDKSKNQSFPILISHDSINEPSNPSRENERLIAAAPEMLEALKDLLQYADGYSHEKGGLDDFLFGQIDAMDAAEKAIAKAEGSDNG